MPTLRKDLLADRWIIVASERDERPRSVEPTDGEPSAAGCPFCAGNEADTLPAVAEVGDDTWQVRVVPNKFPALHGTGELARKSAGIYDEMSGIGTHEVIIESPDHVHDFADLETSQIERVLYAWACRLRAHREDARLKCAVVFKNHGGLAGATQEHTHSQLIALPVVPARLREKLENAKRHYETHETRVFDDIIEQELRTEERLVFENDEIVVVTPYASRFPFELWFLPRRHEAWYENADSRTYQCLAEALRVVCTKLNQALDHPPYNLMLHSAPFTDEDMSHFTWHLELIPTLTNVAGFELGTGFYINPMPPEDAAQQLRDIEV